VADENERMTEGEHGSPPDARFWGTHGHSLDPKGRVILPSRFREPFRQGAFLTKLPEGCIGVWTPQEFDRRTAAMLEKGRQGQAERNVARVWAAGAFDTAPDGQGRIAIPAQLRSYAQLDGEVVVNGAINHLEIWAARKWNDIDTEGSQFLLSGTDALDDIGF
jgi:MraZ protein